MSNNWRKAISPERDRLQSRILVLIFGPALGLLAVSSLTLQFLGSPYLELPAELLVSMIFALIAWKLGSATRGAALCGGIICFLLTSNHAAYLNPGSTPILHSILPPLIVLFLLTFTATKAGKARKRKADLAEDRKGRNAAQVIANLGAAALLSNFPGYFLFDITRSLTHHPVSFRFFTILPLAALTEATADTVSSEIGQAFGGRPILLATLQRVAPGTDGAVTLLGTLAGITGGALVAAIGTVTLGIGFAGFLIAMAAGTAGLFFDSLLGATIERKGWFGNDWVNFSSTVFAALLALFMLAFRWRGIA
jgi:uncharacterized protein (TIGR00297 family)